MGAGKIKFVKRGGLVAKTIQSDDLAAHIWGSDRGNQLDMVRAPDLELPKSIDVVYMSKNIDYQQNTQQSKRMTGSGESSLSLPLPIVMSDEKAAQVAAVNLFLSWAGRTTFTINLSRKYAKLEPTNIIDVVTDTQTYRMRITEKNDSLNGVITLKAQFEDTNVYTQSGTAASTGSIPVQTVSVADITLLYILDVPLADDTYNDPGYYFVAVGSNASWTGCALYKTADGSTYSNVGSINTTAIIGSAVSVLGGFNSGNIFDENNYVDVVILQGTLSSDTEANVLNGSNLALIGDEYIRFKSAALLSAGKYRLSGLLRGRRGTELAINTHAIGDKFILFSSTAWVRADVTTAEIGTLRSIKPVTYGMTLQQTQAVSITNAANGLKPYTVVEVAAGKDASGNIKIVWKRRNRIAAEWRDYVDAPMSESVESYEVEIYSSNTFATLKRTLTGLSTPVASYTSAQQTTDFGSLQTTLYIKVYQISAIVGRGYSENKTISF